MTKREIEKNLAEFLDERYEIVKSEPPESISNLDYYNGACAAVLQIAALERRQDGKHFVSIY